MTRMELVAPRAHHRQVPRWNPWRTLRSRDHITLAFDPVASLGGGALYGQAGDRVAIIIDPALHRRERNAALAHELVHDERGGISDDPRAPASWRAVVAKEEGIVDRIVAQRLVPPEALDAYIDRCLDIDQPVTAKVVADEFDVPVDVAQRALDQLIAATRQRHPSRPRP